MFANQLQNTVCCFQLAVRAKIMLLIKNLNLISINHKLLTHSSMGIHRNLSASFYDMTIVFNGRSHLF